MKTNRLRVKTLSKIDDSDLTLFLISIIYLAFPAILFILFWIKPIFIPLVLIPLGMSFITEYQKIKWSRSPLLLLLDLFKQAKLPIVLAVLWTSIFGAGVLGPKTGDQVKNLAIFRELFVNKWPVIFENLPSSMDFLSYPLGYYLVPAGIAKLFGWKLGLICVSLWITIGIALVFTWIKILFPRRPLLAILLFILFSGLDILGHLAKGAGLPEAGTHLEWWSGWTFLSYSSNALVMGWSSQHAMTQWLVPCILMYCVRNKKLEIHTFLFVAALGFFWSHLTIIGLIIFLPLFTKSKNLDWLNRKNLYSLPYVALVLLFYSSKSPGSIPINTIWNLWSPQFIATRLPLFIFLSFGLISLILHLFLKFESSEEKKLFYSSVSILLLIPIVHMGWSNDFSMRVSSIPLFAIWFFVVQLSNQALDTKNAGLKLVLVVYFFFASFNPFNEMFRQIVQIAPQQFFTAAVTDSNWDRGINRENPNCLITQLPRVFVLNSGDSVRIEGQGTYRISSAWGSDGYQNICLDPTIRIGQRISPESNLKLKFIRGDAILGNRFQLVFYSNLASTAGIESYSPEQYTGSDTSPFFKYLIRKTT